MGTRVRDLRLVRVRDEFYKYLDGRDWLTFDLETQSDESNLEDWHDHSRIVSVSFTFNAGTSYVLPVWHPEERSDAEAIRIFKSIKRSGIQLVGHNLKYDVRWVGSTLDIDLSDQIAWDTMVAAKLLDENESVSLKKLAVKYLGVNPWSENVDLTGPESNSWEDLAYYNALDSDYTHQLHKLQRRQLQQSPDLGRIYWWLLRPALQVLTRVEWRGLKLDIGRVIYRTGRLNVSKAEMRRKLDQFIPKQLERKYGSEAQLPGLEDDVDTDISWSPSSNFFKEYAELSWPVLEETDTGNPSWNKSVLQRLANQGHDDADLLLRYRDVDKKLGTFLKKWPGMADAENRIHTTYNLARTVTGRLSSSGPNLQQVDRELKGCFRCWQVDYSQLEVRITAHESEDEGLLAVYRDGRDVYREMAARIHGKSTEAVTKEERQAAKPVVLGFLYGMMPWSFVDYARDLFGVRYTKDEAEEVHGIFFDSFPGVKDWHEKIKRRVRAFGRVESSLGRVRRLPWAKSKDRYKRLRAERQGINAVIQSLSSDLMLSSLVAIERHIDPDDIRIVGTVHDSALLEPMGAEAELWLDDIAKIMLDPPILERCGLELRVPLAVEFQLGDRWGEGEEVEYDGSRN